MRTFSKLVDGVLPVLGLIIIVVILLNELEISKVGLIVIGILFIQAGLWRMSRNVLPNERRFVRLRTEGDYFIKLLRHLNVTALALKKNDDEQTRLEFDEIHQAMQASVKRMSEVAANEVKHIADTTGKPDAEVLWKNDFFGPP